MSRSWKIGTGGLLAMSLVVGCRQAQPQPQTTECTTCAGSVQPPPAGNAPQHLSLVPTPQPLAPTAPPSLVPATPTPIAARPTPRTDVPRTLPPVVAAPVNPEQSAPPPAPSPWANPKTEAIAPAPTSAPTAVPAPAPTAAPTPTPSVATSPAAPVPQYFNSPDYSILFGVLDFNARRGTWRLRYADAGDEDRYGGCVTLDGVGRQMEGFVSGQFVRVEGGMADPESHEVSPAYRVKDLRPGTAGK